MGPEAFLFIGFFLGIGLGLGITWPVLTKYFNEKMASQEMMFAQKEETFNTRITEREDALEREKAYLLQQIRQRDTQIQEIKNDDVARANQFKALALDTLRLTADDFRKKAEQQFQTHQNTAIHQLNERQTAIKNTIEPLVEIQKRLEGEIRTLEQKREVAYRALTETATKLTEETQSLNRMLSTSNLRGGWGEIVLRKVVEMAGLTEHVDFDRQVAGEGIQPDMVVRLPGRREIVVDSKAPMDAYRLSLGAETEAQRNEFLDKHALSVRGHLDRLSKKEYQSQFHSLEFVVVFIPVEAAYYAALKQDPELVDFQAKKKVLIAGPVTLLAILKAVAYSWREVSMVTNATKIGELAEELHRRFKTFAEHLDKIGKELNETVKAHAKAVGSFSRMLLPQARTLEKYIATEADNLVGEPRSVDEEIRVLALPSEPSDSSKVTGIEMSNGDPQENA